MINHSSCENVSVSRAENALEIRAARMIDANEEILFSYHSASSRFWVCEYGFWLEDNEYDDLDVTEEIEELVAEQRTWLETQGYWGYIFLMYRIDEGIILLVLMGRRPFGFKLLSERCCWISTGRRMY